MTTLAIILKAKKEIERALEGKSNIISRALDTQEFQASQMGKALALLEVAEEQLREIGPEKGPRPGQNASQNINEQGAAETEATDLPEADEKNPDAPQEEARELSQENRPAGAKGLMLLQCPACKRTFKAFMKEPKEEIECEKCGSKIKLDTLTRFEYTCPSCGTYRYGRTNLTEAMIRAGITKCGCGEPSPSMTWDKDKRCYHN